MLNESTHVKLDFFVLMNVFVMHALKLISPLKLGTREPPLNWFKGISFTLNYSLEPIRREKESVSGHAAYRAL